MAAPNERLRDTEGVIGCRASLELGWLGYAGPKKPGWRDEPRPEPPYAHCHATTPRHHVAPAHHAVPRQALPARHVVPPHHTAPAHHAHRVATTPLQPRPRPAGEPMAATPTASRHARCTPATAPPATPTVVCQSCLTSSPPPPISLPPLLLSPPLYLPTATRGPSTSPPLHLFALSRAMKDIAVLPIIVL
ncbi:36.4 kDa proline-rich protein-like [Miscanthus floridulus]|uniref:36.4 kDa proline-rich protein-like n=1 Tax=Miscanthus floridulus TaxID=154761 RepID=UPI003457DC6A